MSEVWLTSTDEERWTRGDEFDKDVRDRIKRLRADGQNKAADAWEAARRG